MSSWTSNEKKNKVKNVSSSINDYGYYLAIFAYYCNIMYKAIL